MTAREPKPVLRSGAVYMGDGGRLACASVRCAGSSALYTGRDLSGHRVTRATVAHVAEWQTYDLGPLRCECRAVTLSPIAGPDGWPAVAS